MSMNNLTMEGEFRYIVQWFNEWSEFQRDDFVTTLVEYLTTKLPTIVSSSSSSSPLIISSSSLNNSHSLSLTSSVVDQTYMNGIADDMNKSLTYNDDKPMTLFQCRIKLFRQWHPKWPFEFKQRLCQKISEIDPKIYQRVLNKLYSNNESNWEPKITDTLLDDGSDDGHLVANMTLKDNTYSTAVVDIDDNVNHILNIHDNDDNDLKTPINDNAFISDGNIESGFEPSTADINVDQLHLDDQKVDEPIKIQSLANEEQMQLSNADMALLTITINDNEEQKNEEQQQEKSFIPLVSPVKENAVETPTLTSNTNAEVSLFA